MVFSNMVYDLSVEIRESITDHKNVINALKKKSPKEARKMMERHLLDIRNTIYSNL